jgi:PEP-CTERM motif-containing protein
MRHARMLVMGFASTISLCMATSAHAGQIYGFQLIADTTIRSAPAINNDGVVAFAEATVPDAFGKIETSNGVATTVIGNSDGSVYGVWINDFGQVAFRDAPVSGVFNAVRGSGGALTVIGPENRFLPAIDDSGNVTFAEGSNALGSQTYGIYSGNGGALTTILPTAAVGGDQYTSEFEGFATSHNGIIAYEQYPSSSATSGQQIMTYQSGARKVITTLSTDLGSGVESLAVNNSGMVEIDGSLSSNDAGIFLGNGTTFTTAFVDTAQFFSDAAGPASINNLNEIAFQASYLPGGSSFNGIYTGQDPVQDKVIQTGDALGGSTVTALTYGNDALNDSGQVVFWAELANGTSGIYTATPVPEPSTAVLALFAIGALLLLRRPTHIMRSFAPLAHSS